MKQHFDGENTTTTTTTTIKYEGHRMLMYLKMSFIFSAVLEGWSVKMLSENQLCFTKKNVKKHYSVETFLRKHLNQFKF